MRIMKRASVFITILIIGLNNYGYSNTNQCTQEPIEILFLGSSHFNYFNLPGMVKNLAENSGREVYIDQNIPSGLSLYDHASSSITEWLINSRDWDYVVLQGVGIVTAYPVEYTSNPLYPALEKLQEKIYENCDSTKMVFCLPWAFEDGMTWLEGWTDTYDEMQLKIRQNTLSYSNDLGFLVAPVGTVWNSVLIEKDYPLHYLHNSDMSHPSLKGSYLMACVIFSTIFQASTVGIDYNSGIPEEEADYFKTIASNTVLNNLDLWNIPRISTGIDGFSISNGLYLHQNYPNPFYSSTIINYETPYAAIVEISVYDIFGKKSACLLNEYKLPGEYSLVFNADHLKSGMYSCMIRIGRQFQIRKMLLIR